MIKMLLDWLNDRTGYRAALRAWLDHPVPGGVGWRHVLPRCLVFLFVVEVVTGVPLMTVYTPSITSAWGSVYHLEHAETLGWWVRGVHHYASWLMVGLLPLYLLHIVFARLYVPPRELAYWCALGCMPLIVALGLSGNVLPWDQSGYWAIHVETIIVSTWPVVGEALQRLVLGGAGEGQATLTRLYALHVVVLPVLLTLLFGLYRVVRRPPAGGGEPHWPRQAVRNVMAYAVLAAAAVGMTVVFRTPLDAPADPDSVFPARPEWYMLFLYRLRKDFETTNELYATALIPVATTFVLLFFPALGRIRFRRVTHAFVVLMTLGLVGSGVTLTVLGMRADRRDPQYQAERTRFGRYAARAVELAAAGIPLEGAGVLLKRDPKTRGPILFGEHCVRCHHYAGIDGPGEEASNLTGYATREWIERLIADPGHPDFFGQAEKLTRMAQWSEDNIEDIGPAGVRAVAAFLAAGAPPETLATGEADNAPATSNAADSGMGSGRQMFMEYCFECHTLADQEPRRKKKRRTKGVDLTGYATPAWTRRMLIDPGHPDLYGRKNQMPSFKDPLSETDVNVLVRWLHREK